MLDRITLHGLIVRGHHGWLAEERQAGQEFRVDVALGLDTRTAAASDDLADTVDYGDLASRVVALAEGQPVRLIEKLAERIAVLCLEDQRVKEVEVTVHKPQAPIAVPFEDVTVTIRRMRT